MSERRSHSEAMNDFPPPPWLEDGPYNTRTQDRVEMGGGEGEEVVAGSGGGRSQSMFRGVYILKVLAVAAPPPGKNRCSEN